MLKRRQRMLRLLAIGNGLKVVVETISSEFNVPKKTVYSDYYNMADWVRVLQQDKQLSALVRERLDLLNREMFGLMLEIDAIGEKKASIKERYLKVNAAIAALKVVQEQIKLGQNLGLIEQRPLEILQNQIVMPFAVNPDVRRAWEAEAARQAAEKAKQDKARDADGKISDDSGH